MPSLGGLGLILLVMLGSDVGLVLVLLLREDHERL